ncbi:YcgJ family protein [Providencia manganoxydans]|uniref:YcgJ family protein n=1 Tax=Providencia manganoxydans TaxID=2923283 RepID=UPI0034E5D3DC
MFAIILGSISFSAVTAELDFPQPGVICDPIAKYCVDKQGLSLPLTQLYLGIDALQHLRDMLGNEDKVNKHEFTFSNGVHCDTTKKQCYRDRYYPRTLDKQEIPLTQYLFGQSAASVKP